MDCASFTVCVKEYLPAGSVSPVCEYNIFYAVGLKRHRDPGTYMLQALDLEIPVHKLQYAAEHGVPETSPFYTAVLSGVIGLKAGIDGPYILFRYTLSCIIYLCLIQSPALVLGKPALYLEDDPSVRYGINGIMQQILQEHLYLYMVSVQDIGRVGIYTYIKVYTLLSGSYGSLLQYLTHELVKLELIIGHMEFA